MAKIYRLLYYSIYIAVVAAALVLGRWISVGLLLLAGFLHLLHSLLWPTVQPPQGFQVIVVGAGTGGIAMGKRLNDLGIRYIILEKGEMLGGTWYYNTYPGCECDCFAHFYSFSFFLNPNWSKAYPTQKEILQYLHRAATKFGVLPNIKFNTTVLKNTWDADRSLWIVETNTGEKLEGNVMVSAAGSMHQARYPDIPGIIEFNGDSFHTSKWDKNFQPKGKRIAVIGTGASAVQVVPSLADQKPASLMVFQRSAVWPIPRGDFEYSAFIKTIFTIVPLAVRLYRWYVFWRADIMATKLFTIGIENSHLREQLTMHIKNTIKDQDVAAKLTPDYEVGCKRPVFADNYLPTFNKEFVQLNTMKIDSITQQGIKTVDMIEHEFDAIVYATGFDVVKSINAFRQGGIKDSLEENLGKTPKAYLGITHPNYPNFFMLFGPGTVATSVIYMNECQVEYIIDGITKMLRMGAKSLVVKSDTLQKYQEFIQEANDKSSFGKGACTSYYKNESGHNWVVWPKMMSEYWWKTCTFVLNEYNIHI